MKRGLVFALFVCVTVVLAKRNTIDIAHVQVSDGEDIVNTPLGAVQGLVFPVSRGFFSIPYGDNTGGSNRWLPPKDPPAWGNTLNATTFGPACPQNCDFPPFTCPQAGFSEDCLKVDVYTPRLSVIQSKGLRPVMVFFPGGGFTAGGSSTMLYTGNYLANNTEVVVVIVNYRLGALGFFKNNEFQGNLGIIDQTFALKWVNQYIKPFGGDPTQVTIFGESAGGMSIACQLISPPAKPYFRAAIMESNPIQLGLNTKREIETLSKNFASLVNCSVNDQACLNSLDTDTILDAQTKAAFKISLSHPLSAFMAWEPWVDGKIISGQPIESFQKGTYNQVPVILGNVNDEGWMFIYSAFTKPMPKVEYEALLDVIFRDQAKKVLAQYPVPANETADARPVLAVLGTDYLFACPLRNVSRHMATYNPLYLYHFDHVFSFDPWGPDYAFCIDKCCHGSELPFVFNSAANAGYQWDAQEAILAQFMSTNWGNFAISGNPNTPFATAFQWPVYTLSNQVDFHFVTPQPVLEYNYRSTYCDFFDSIGYGFGVAA